jgi:uncharacterized membrane protein
MRFGTIDDRSITACGTDPMTLFTSKKAAGILIGAAYGLAIRYGLAKPELHSFINTISAAFLFVCPFSVGAIAVLWGAERGTALPLGGTV